MQATGIVGFSRLLHLPGVTAGISSLGLNFTQRAFLPKTPNKRAWEYPGVSRDPLKYHVFPDKKPEQPYGFQGTNHLLPQKGKIAQRLPLKFTLLKDKVYAWCACGYSNNQPFCDGTHREIDNTQLRPVRYIPEKDMEVWLCCCKQTSNRPFCDGTHKKLPEPEPFTPVSTKKK